MVAPTLIVLVGVTPETHIIGCYLMDKDDEDDETTTMEDGADGRNNVQQWTTMDNDDDAGILF